MATTSSPESGSGRTGSLRAPCALWRFGSFEVDPETEELRKSGVRLHLPSQPFQVLMLLLRRAGDVVSREELQQWLWPEGPPRGFGPLSEYRREPAANHAMRHRRGSPLRGNAAAPRLSLCRTRGEGRERSPLPLGGRNRIGTAGLVRQIPVYAEMVGAGSGNRLDRRRGGDSVLDLEQPILTPGCLAAPDPHRSSGHGNHSDLVPKRRTNRLRMGRWRRQKAGYLSA